VQKLTVIKLKGIAFTDWSAINQRQVDIETLFQISRPFWIDTNNNISNRLLINLVLFKSTVTETEKQ